MSERAAATRWRALFVVLLIAATAALAIGMSLERSETGESAERIESGESGEPAGGDERVGGLDLESTPVIVGARYNWMSSDWTRSISSRGLKGLRT